MVFVEFLIIIIFGLCEISNNTVCEGDNLANCLYFTFHLPPPPRVNKAVLI